MEKQLYVLTSANERQGYLQRKAAATRQPWEPHTVQQLYEARVAQCKDKETEITSDGVMCLNTSPLDMFQPV